MNKAVKIMMLTGVGGGRLGGSEIFVIGLIRRLDKTKFLPVLCLDLGGDIAEILRRQMSAIKCNFFATKCKAGMKIDLQAVF